MAAQGEDQDLPQQPAYHQNSIPFPNLNPARPAITEIRYDDGSSYKPGPAHATAYSYTSSMPSSLCLSRESSVRRARAHATSLSSNESQGYAGSQIYSYGGLGPPSVDNSSTTMPDAMMCSQTDSNAETIRAESQTNEHVTFGEDHSGPSQPFMFEDEFTESPTYAVASDPYHMQLTAQIGSFTAEELQYLQTMDDSAIVEPLGDVNDLVEHPPLLDGQPATLPGVMPQWLSRGRSTQQQPQQQQPPAEVPTALAAQRRDAREAATTRTGRRPGRAIGTKLSERRRKKAAILRVIGACQYCKQHRRSCGAETPCKPCIMHYGAEILDHPEYCRGNFLQTLCAQILPSQAQWYPFPRETKDFFGSRWKATGQTATLPVYFMFGPPMQCLVEILHVDQPSLLRHKHVYYDDPDFPEHPIVRDDVVLPVKFANPDSLLSALDRHLNILVTNHVHDFNYHNSPFHVLDKIHQLYQHYCQTNPENSILLLQAFKLLVLVQSADFSVSMDDPTVQFILHASSSGYDPAQQKRVWACLLRAEIGKVMPQLAEVLLNDVLRRLLRICFERRGEQHAIMIAGFSVLMMTIESIMYHTGRVGFHAKSRLPTASANTNSGIGGNRHLFASMAHPLEAKPVLMGLDQAATSLRRMYHNCFGQDHDILLRIIDGQHLPRLHRSNDRWDEKPMKFLLNLNSTIQDSRNYLEAKRVQRLEVLQETILVFDRSLAQLFLRPDDEM